MGLFGTVSWALKGRKFIIFWVVASVTLTAWATSMLSVFFPITYESTLRICFQYFCFLVLCYLLYSVWAKEQPQKENLDITPKNVVIILFSGIISGLFVGYIGVGTDMILFLVLNGFFKIESQVAIGTCVVTTGVTALLPFLMKAFYLGHCPWSVFLMGIGGVVIGARGGGIINHLLGKEKIMLVFGAILLAEILRTPIEYGIKSLNN
eukprot:TRINITY_DN4284_c0_g1_i1.p1 TRINITY_DN4284_c0_g1~~TRINITY_DN4284_c0_g1_i1.p1  ORF type:complete len:208 (-),score=11.73 TRINITY_DN4284_c0_g1_i1:24-647(-)